MSQYSDRELYVLVNSQTAEEYYEYYPARRLTPRSWASKRDRLKDKGKFDKWIDPNFPDMFDVFGGEDETEDDLAAPTVTRITGITAGEKPDIQAIISKHRQTFRKQKELAERKQWQEVQISHGPAMIALVSDTHLGGPGCDVDRVFAEQDLINATPGAYTFLLGDIADSFLVGRLRDQNMTHDVTVPEEWLLVEHYVNRWQNLLGFVGGNHDAWSRTLVGRDLHRDLIEDGKVLYDTDDMRVTVNVGISQVRFRFRHQFLGSSQWNPSHAAEKSVKMDDAWPDVLVSGHTHAGAFAREFSHSGKRKIAVQLGSYKPIDQWATQVGFPGTDNSTAAAVIVMPDGSYFATGSLASACSFMRAVYSRAA